MAEKVKAVRDWPTSERTLLMLLTWGAPAAWRAIWNGEYKGGDYFQTHIERVHSWVSSLSPRTRT